MGQKKCSETCRDRMVCSFCKKQLCSPPPKDNLKIRCFYEGHYAFPGMTESTVCCIECSDNGLLNPSPARFREHLYE